jgi:hypothetical protein
MYQRFYIYDKTRWYANETIEGGESKTSEDIDLTAIKENK